MALPPAAGPPDEPPTADGAEGHEDTPGFGGFLRYFLWLGTFGFGGPIATVGYMQRDLVGKRRWVSERDFLDGVALGQTMPGPLAAQVAMWVGYLQRGALGAVAVAVPFILPSFVLVLGVAVVYARYQGLEVISALFYGIAPAVMAIIAIAAYKLARLTNRADARLWVISAIVLAVTAATASEIAFLFIAAGLVMMIWEAPPGFVQRFSHRGAGAVVALANGSGPTLLAGATLSTQATLFLFFLKAGAFIFGSGLAIVPFLREGVVHQHHWLTQRQFLDAVAIGLMTPGPVVITATFIGYLVGGFAGAALATVAIFTPIYLGVVIPGRWFVRHRDHPRLQGFVKGATAAAAGAIGGATIVLTRGAVVDYRTALIALLALALLLRFKIKEPFIVLAAGLAGLLLH